MSQPFLAAFGLALNITAPIFLLVLLGYGLRKWQLMSDSFVEAATRLVFNIGLPTLMFLTVLNADLEKVVNVALVSVGALATVATFASFTVISLLMSKTSERGVMVQGAFRGNLGIIGLAYCFSAYGEDGIASAALYTGVCTVLYNIFSVIILTLTLNANTSLRQVCFSVLKNPLIIGIGLGFLVNYLRLPLPEALLEAGSYISSMTLPLALLCIGASMSMRFLTKPTAVSMLATGLKLLAAPAMALAIALCFELTKIELGIVFLMSAAPTASASYIMVRAMQGDGRLAASIVVLSTILSVLTVSAGMALLKVQGLI